MTSTVSPIVVADRNQGNRLRFTSAAELLSSLAPAKVKILTRPTSSRMEHDYLTTTGSPNMTNFGDNQIHSNQRPVIQKSSPSSDVAPPTTAGVSPVPSQRTSSSRNSSAGAIVQPRQHSSGRSNSTSSGNSSLSLESDNSSSSTSKRSSWTRAIFFGGGSVGAGGGQRSKSQSSLSNLDHHQQQLSPECVPAVPTCLKGHETRLRKITECTQKNVNGLIVRTQHTEADVLQMVARHCNHVGCRRKAINAAMRNLERRISMLNKYRDAIFHFVVNQHQEVLQSAPAKKAEAEALYDLCVRSSKLCMDQANQGAHTSGTILVSLSDRLHKLQRQLNENSQNELGQPNSQGAVQHGQLVSSSNNNSTAASNGSQSPTRSMSAMSLSSHGEGETEDYVMGVVPTVPQSIQFKLQRPAKPSRQCSQQQQPTASFSSVTGVPGAMPGDVGSAASPSGARNLCARSSKLQKLSSQDNI